MSVMVPPWARAPAAPLAPAHILPAAPGPGSGLGLGRAHEGYITTFCWVMDSFGE
jgi:hypothetical protein